MIFISIVTLIVTLLVLYLINRTFNNFKIEKISMPFKLNVKSDKVIILSKNGCPWCEKLDPYIYNSKKECIKIVVNNDDTFKFDEKFANLKYEERETIIRGSRDLLENTGYYFPSLIYKNEYIIGFPEEKTLNKLFNE
jgi:thioredoxin-related protein